MRATLQLEVLKKLMVEQHGVPPSITDQLDNLYRLTYREGYADAKRDLKDEVSEQREGEGL